MGGSRRVVLHVDMDAFYASVEILRDPTLADKPVIVGGEGARGVVASCNYIARSFGIRSAMPSVQARRLCPTAAFVSGDHKLYEEYSRAIHNVFSQFSPLVEPIALDEAFIDITGTLKLFGSGAQAALAIRTQVHQETELWCSIGIARNKFFAKLASKAAKPKLEQGRPSLQVGTKLQSTAVLEVEPAGEEAFLLPMPVRAIWGVGPKTAEKLSRLGISSVAELRQAPLETLYRCVGKALGTQLYELSRGIDERPVVPASELKSIGHEETFSADLRTLPEVERELLRLSDAVASRLRKAGFVAKGVQLKVKFGDFKILTRSKVAGAAFSTSTPIYRTACELLNSDQLTSAMAQSGIRLVGVSVYQLAPPAQAEAEQLGLFDAFPGEQAQHFSPSDPMTPQRTPGQEVALASAIDAIRARYGAGSVGVAAFATKGKLRIKEAGDTKWGPKTTTGED